MNTKLLQIFLLAVILLGCPSRERYVSMSGDMEYTDTIQRIAGYQFATFDELKNHVFRLYPISPDSAEVEIRILRTYGMTVDLKSSIFILKQRIDKKWTAFGATMKVLDVGEDRMARYIPANIKLKKNKIDWWAVADRLISFKILELRNYNEITGYDVPTDSDTVEVEVVYKGKIIRYSLPSPEGNDSIPDAQSMMKILYFIESEVGFSGFAMG